MPKEIQNAEDFPDIKLNGVTYIMMSYDLDEHGRLVIMYMDSKYR